MAVAAVYYALVFALFAGLKLRLASAFGLGEAGRLAAGLALDLPWIVALCSLSRRGRRGVGRRVLELAVPPLLVAAFAANHVYFHFFRQNLLLSTVARNLEAERRPWRTALDAFPPAALVFAAALAVATAVFLATVARGTRASRASRPPRARRRAGAALAVAALLLSVGIVYRVRFAAPSQLDYASPITPNIAAALAAALPPAPVDRPAAIAAYRALLADQERAAPPAAAFRAAEAARLTGRRNVLLIVLESVGSDAMLAPDGRSFAPAFPKLAAAAATGAVWANVYTHYPGSPQSYFYLHTFGQPLTEKTTAAAAQRVYGGPTLSDAFADRGFLSGMFVANFARADGAELLFRHFRFDKVFIPDLGVGDFFEKNRVNAWAVDERPVAARLFAWLGSLPPGRPWFAEFYTGTTHYPYMLPRDVGARCNELGIEARHACTLRFTDDLLAGLRQELARLGLLAGTTIVITGDHGQAFGDRHRGNFLHRNYLYEENLRVPLVVLDPRLEGTQWLPTVFDHAEVGGLLLRLADAAGPRARATPVDPDFREKPLFFTKSMPPAMLGVRVGRLKYIGQVADGRFCELYDIARDPEEQDNLGPAAPDRCRALRRAALGWYATADDEGVRRLSALPSPRPAPL